MQILAIIQARGGSKSIPRKNIKPLLGKPLIAWTIEEARKSKYLNRLIVSTDDKEIAEIAKSYGAEVPFLRPSELAYDAAKSIGLLKHALEWLKQNENYEPDVVVQLKPTNPLRTAAHIDYCLERYLQYHPKIDSLITLAQAINHPLKTYKFEREFISPFVPEETFGLTEASKMPRQSLPEAYVQNSCVNVINPETILKKDSSLGTRVVGVVMKREESVNIDDLLDFEIAEMIIKKKFRQS